VVRISNRFDIQCFIVSTHLTRSVFVVVAANPWDKWRKIRKIGGGANGAAGIMRFLKTSFFAKPFFF
jgi:hypothetical protein